MEIYKTYRFRAYPTEGQRQQFAQTFGCSRYIYNWALEMRTNAYHEGGESVGYYETKRRLTALKKDEEHSWLYDVSSVVLQESVRNLERAFTNFFEGRAQYPRFKRKKGDQVAHYLKNAFSLSGEEKRPAVKLAKQKEPLEVRYSRDLEGEVVKLCVTHDPAGRYHICITCKVEQEPLPSTGSAVGVDFGLTDVVVTSDGFKGGNPKHYHADLHRLRRAQRRLSRKEKGSRNWDKQKRKVARLHARIADKRSDFIHKLTTRLVKNHDTIVVETLAVKNMQKNHTLASHIADSAWGEIIRQLEYKAEWYGRDLIKVDRWFPSTKRCSECGYVMDAIPLSKRRWQCPSCGSQHDRDVNAAINLKQVGTAGLAGSHASGGQRKTSPAIA